MCHQSWVHWPPLPGPLIIALRGATPRTDKAATSPLSHRKTVLMPSGSTRGDPLGCHHGVSSAGARHYCSQEPRLVH